jgi:hypothetical protein
MRRHNVEVDSMGVEDELEVCVLSPRLSTPRSLANAQRLWSMTRRMGNCGYLLGHVPYLTLPYAPFSILVSETPGLSMVADVWLKRKKSIIMHWFSTT